MVRHGSTYMLLYSANDYGGEQYATGYATASKVTGPYVKADEPLLTMVGTGVAGPGGQDVVVAGDCTTIVFHGWDAAFVSRGMYTESLQWRGGRPEVDLG